MSLFLTVLLLGLCRFRVEDGHGSFNTEENCLLPAYLWKISSVVLARTNEELSMLLPSPSTHWHYGVSYECGDLYIGETRRSLEIRIHDQKTVTKRVHFLMVIILVIFPRSPCLICICYSRSYDCLCTFKQTYQRT